MFHGFVTRRVSRHAPKGGKKGKAANFPPGEFSFVTQRSDIGPGAAAETTLHQ